MFVRRDEAGAIMAVSRERIGDVTEWLADGHPDLVEFLHADGAPEISRLRASDLEVARVVEDLVDLLIDKGVIRFTDLPDAAQDKLIHRKSLRSAASGTNLVDDDDEEGLI